MGKWILTLVSICLSVGGLFPRVASAYIGENPGLDFYSKIDEGHYTILEKTVSKRLSEKPTLGEFGAECPGIDRIASMRTSTDTLDAIESGAYADISARIAASGKSMTTDTFQALTQCLREKYQTIRERAQRETNARETISYLGLYMDGDTSNSDYDIISDIEKINMLIFSEKLEYNGVQNQASRELADFLAGKIAPGLFGNNSSPSSNNASTGNASTTSGSGTTATSDLSSLLSSTCTTSGTVIPIDTMADEGFLTELDAILANGNIETADTSAGYSALPDRTSSTRGVSGLTSANDFFHTLPCTTIFCIRQYMRTGQTNFLGGGKNKSIEGILDKHAAIMDPIAASNLSYQTMTMNNAEYTFKGLQFANMIRGLKVYIQNSPQITRRDKREVTPKSEAEILEDIMRCGRATAGLDTDATRSNSVTGGGYMGNPTSTETTASRIVALGPQEANERQKYTDCLEFHMEGSRKSYYDSFSTDLTELAAYTASMLHEIESIVATLDPMKHKPVK